MNQLLHIALAIAAPASGQTARAALPPQEQAALQSYLACFYQQVANADDGAADADAIARKVAPACRDQLGAAATVFSQGKSQAERDALYSKWLALEEGLVTRMVLAARQQRLATQSAPATPPPSTDSKTAAAKPPAAKPGPAATTDKPMSEWRRAYIARHGHEPPVPAK